MTIRRARALTVLSALYFVQGLPYGFQVTALPAYLRTAGVSLAAIGLASLLSLPWVLKLAAGPFVDRFGSVRWGRRRSWIAPLQLLLAVACGWAAWSVDGADLELRPLLMAVLAANLCAAIMDVAVDALAVDVLEPAELGYGNIAQVVGYKLGMLAGGGLLVSASEALGFGLSGVFLGMAVLVVVVALGTLAVSERAMVGRATPVPTPPPSLAEVVRSLSRAIRVPGGLWLVAFVATYKLGETIADTMFKPFLIDVGYTTAEVGFWLGTFGLAWSVIGSIGGGVLASRIGPLAAVGWAAALRAAAVGGEWWLATIDHPAATGLAVVIAAEQLFGGALTTALFALMMMRVDRTIGATHYTFLATIEVAGKLVAAQVSGFIAEGLGYVGAFALATGLAMAFLALLIPVRSPHREEPT